MSTLRILEPKRHRRYLNSATLTGQFAPLVGWLIFTIFEIVRYKAAKNYFVVVIF